MPRHRNWTALLLIGAAPAYGGLEEGMAAFRSGDYATAETEFRGVVESSPDVAAPYYLLGTTLQRLGRGDEARTHLRRAYEIEPSVVNAFALGQAYYRAGLSAEAAAVLGDLDASSLAGDQLVALYTMRGQARYRSDDAAGAAADFEQLAVLRPDDLGVQSSFAGLAVATGQLDKGIAAYERATTLAGANADPDDDSSVWRGLGYAYERAGHYADAVTAYERAGDEISAVRARRNGEIARANAEITAENERIREIAEDAERVEREFEELQPR